MAQNDQLHPPVGPDDHVQGAASAPVTLVEYGDYECPHCARAYPIVKGVQARTGGQMRFVFRNFPLAQVHAHAEAAAEASEAAAAQGRFWAMHDLLFEKQTRLGRAHLEAYAKQLGLDVGAFNAALESGVFAAKVKADFRGGIRSGVNGTPTFFINGVRFDGDWTNGEALVAAIEFAASHG